MKAEQKNIIGKIINVTGILGISVVMGILLLCLVYMLPTERMQKHVSSDVEMLQREGNYSVFWDGFFERMHPGNINVRTFFLNNRGMARDNLTDAIMLGNAVYEGGDKSVLEKALGVYRYIDESKMPINSLQVYLDKENTGWGEEAAYPRYWHGYLVILKPLLCILTYSQIRIFNILLQGILLIFLSIKMGTKTDWKYSICLLGGVLVSFPFVIPLCMQYSTAVYVMLSGCTIYLDHINYWEKEGRNSYFFMLIGIVTSYVDFLTYPIITLGGLLVIGVLATGEQTGYIIKNSVMWCIGYFGMWFGKWMAASIILKENIIKDGFEQMLFRTSNATDTMTDKKISALSAVLANFSSMTNIYYIAVFLLLLIFLISVIKKQQKFRLKNIVKQRHFLLIALYPFIWYAAIKNHSYDHSSFTYRALFVTVFALMAMLVRSCEKVDGSYGDYLNKK